MWDLDKEIRKDTFVEEVYFISPRMKLVLEQHDKYILIDDIYFDIQSLKDNFKEEVNSIKISNDYEIKEISTEEIEEIYSIFSLKNFKF